VLREPVNRVVGNCGQPGERGGHDDRAALRHHPVEAAHAVDDAVDVDAERATVLLVREIRQLPVVARDDAGVQAGEVDRADVLPRRWIGHVEAVDQVQLLHLEAFRRELSHDRGSDAAGGSCDERCHGMRTTFPVD
jgi:hypothetical protein